MDDCPTIPLSEDIKNKPQLLRFSFNTQNTYEALFLTTIVIAFSFTIFYPHTANAFWFFNNTEAAQTENIPPLHDAQMTLLRAQAIPNPKERVNDEEDIFVSDNSALVAISAPEGQAKAREAKGVYAPTSGSISLYVVREGETLSEVAKMYGVSVSTILWANDIKNAKHIQPGDTLLILPVSGISHTVKKGDTLSTLAKKYGANEGDIAAFNGLNEDAPLSVGESIIIPGGEMPQETRTSGTRTARVGGNTSSLPAISGFFAHPVPGARVTQGIHGWNGIDFGAPTGTSVYASAGGRVIVAKAGGWNGGYGSYVVIDHGNGTQTLYAHLSSVSISSGESVSQGDLLGAVGSTGRSTGPHLHFEVRGAKNPFAR